MIKKLKIKVILLSMGSLLILLAALVAGMNLINYTSVISEADAVLSLLSQHQGRFPDMIGGFPSQFSPELAYESRYFSVLYNEKLALLLVETGNISSVDSEDAVDFAERVLAMEYDSGFVGDFRYLRSEEGNGVRITFLDCGRKLDAFSAFLLTSIVCSLIGYVLVFLIVFFLAGRIIRPIAESYEKQKRFITDAGHEIKTPLTIISANVDLLEMELEQNESLEEIRTQTARLASLTNDLVYLTRMEESETSIQKIEFPISEVAEEAVLSFKAPALAQEKKLDVEIQPLLSLSGDVKAVTQLITLLMDNALKYSPIGSTITVRLSAQPRAVVFSVCNQTESEVDPKTFEHVFDRFYRTDPSRNSETGGHGIGLSVAKAIVNAHDGKIGVWTKDRMSFGITVSFPL